MPSTPSLSRTENPARQYGSYVIMLDGEGRPKLLGKGTFGRTYLAQHHYLETLAALKVINERFASEAEARERFLREGRALVRLDHRHIARLLDFGEADGALFYALEYCSGGDLANRVQVNGPMPLEQWLTVARQLASALDSCHRAGFIHRDLKPSNVMLAFDRDPLVVKLIDFGLVHAELRREDDSTAVGTPLYASPEQLLQEKVDARSDLFSLGMTLWHLAIGAPPETGSNAQIITSRLSSESYRPKIPPHLPSKLRDLLAALVEKDKMGRPEDASEVIATLSQAARELGLQPGIDDTAGEALQLSTEPGQSFALDDPEPTEVRQVSKPLASEFQVGSLAAEQNTGINYLARRTAGAEAVWLHSIHPQLVADEVLYRKLRIAVSRLRLQAVPHCLRPLDLCAFIDFTVLVSTAPQGEQLSTELKAHGKCALAAVFPLIHRIGETADRMLLGGLPGVELRANCIYVTKGALTGAGEFEVELIPRFLRGQDTIDLARAIAPRDSATNTMTVEMLDDESGAERPAIQFARLIYRLVAGRECVAAASASARGYVAVAEFSEGANRLLSQVIAGLTTHATCAALLADLQGQGLGGPTASRVASRTTSASASQASATATHPGSSRTAILKSSIAPASATQTAAPIVVPPPILDRPPPLRAIEPKPEIPRWVITFAGAAAALLVFGILATGLVWKLTSHKPNVTTPGGGGESATGEEIPAGATIQLIGEFPARSTFFVDGKTVTPATTVGNATLPLPPGRRLPVEVGVKAPGYRQATYTLAALANTRQPQPVEFERSKGTLALSRTGSCDYAEVTVKMIETLPAEEGVVAVDHFPYNKGMPSDEREPVRWELPTGRYQLTLRGVNGQVRPRQFGKVTIEEGAEQPCALPPSFVGAFQGSVKDAAPAGAPTASHPITLRLGRNLTEGELIAGQTVPLDDLRVNSDGILTATAKFSTAPGAPAYDQKLTAQLNYTGDELEISLTEIFTEDRALRDALKRPAYPESDWLRRGALKRQR